MYLIWSDSEESSHTCLCLRVPLFYIMKNIHEHYMQLALKEAEKAKEIDEVPVGAVIVKDGKVIARAHNLKEKKKLSYAHAEMLAIEKASKKTGNYYLNDCDLYVTLEPCMMCTGNIVLSRIRHVYYGTKDPKGGCMDSVIQLEKLKKINHHPQITYGVLQEECAAILKNFFKLKRELKKNQQNTK